MIIKMTTKYFGVSYYTGEGYSFAINKKNAKIYKDKSRARKHCESLKLYWDRCELVVINE